jgi:hypothetical protein
MLQFCLRLSRRLNVERIVLDRASDATFPFSDERRSAAAKNTVDDDFAAVRAIKATPYELTSHQTTSHRRCRVVRDRSRIPPPVPRSARHRNVEQARHRLRRAIDQYPEKLFARRKKAAGRIRFLCCEAAVEQICLIAVFCCCSDVSNRQSG